MALASDIIKRAYREANLIPLGTDVTAYQQSEALDLLNAILLSTIGNEAGDPLRDIRLGGDSDDSALVSDHIPANARLVLNLTSAMSLDLDPSPQNGQRLMVIDALGNLATYNLTLNGNGNTIEYDDPLVIADDNAILQWIYQADEANWTKVASMDVVDFIPFPDEFSDYFSIMLAMRLNPRYGQSLAPETVEYLHRMRSQLRARYSQISEIFPDLDTRGYFTDKYTYFTSQDDFNKGRTWWK